MVVDAEGRETEEGKLYFRLEPAPMGLMPGYQDQDGSCAPIAGPVYRTGDVVSRDSEGSLTIVGRAGDICKASDNRISPFELESALVEHSTVVECAVVPSPDPVRPAVPKAFIALKPGLTSGPETALTIFRHIRKTLAPYKRVRRIEFGDLPKAVSGDRFAGRNCAAPKPLAPRAGQGPGASFARKIFRNWGRVFPMR